MGTLGLRERERIYFTIFFFKTEHGNLIFEMSITGPKDIQYAFCFEIYFNLAITLLGIYLTDILEQVPESG